MDDLKGFVEERAFELVKENDAHNAVGEILKEGVSRADGVKTAIDLMFTHDALQDNDTFDVALKEKKEELRNDAEAKRIEAETNKIEKEVARIKQEKEKELAEFDKLIDAKRKEAEHLKAESDRAQAFFEFNKDILSYVGVQSKKTLKVMYMLLIPAIIIFAIVQIIALPFTISGKLLELIINIVSNVCKAITNNSLKIIIAVLVIASLLICSFCAYYFTSKFLIFK